MSELDPKWVEEQFIKARLKVGVGKAVLKLIDAWSSVNLKGKDVELAFAIAARLVQGHAIVEERKDEKWLPVQPGFIKVNDTVRVMSDAFDGELGTIHNGRRGVVTAIRSGDIIVKSTDGLEPLLDGVHYSPYKLEKLIS
jgi:hypothetical protein